MAGEVAAALPEVEVLAVELAGPERLCVYIDHPEGVDHALCEQVTNVLRGYLDPVHGRRLVPRARAAAAKRGAFRRRRRKTRERPHES